MTEGEHKNVELLIKHNADVNLQDNLGRTPLHQAIIRWCNEIVEPEFFDSPDLYKEIAKELLFNGADRQLKNKAGQRAIDILDDHLE